MTATVQNSEVSEFQSLADQLKTHKGGTEKPQKEESKTPPPSDNYNIKKFQFKKGDKTFDIDEDAEIEFVADKQPIKMKLSDLKDRAAGDVAIKNRMHSLAEEKKKVQATLKEFSSIAKKDPLKALEFISKQVKESDSDFEYENYLTALADQAEKLSQMDDKERRAHLAEKKLEEVEGDLNQKRIDETVRLKAQASMEKLGIEESDFNKAAQIVLGNNVLMERCENEEEFFQTVEELVVKANNQKIVQTAISRVDPSEATNQELIISLADVVEELLPDANDNDVLELVSEVLKPKAKQKAEIRLSEKQRYSMPMDQIRSNGLSDYEILVEELKERKQVKK